VLLYGGSQPTYNFPYLFCLRKKLVKFDLLQITYVKSNIKLRTYLCTGRLRNGEKLVELSRPTSLKALSKIGHDRDCCSLDLI